jgi:hypothetical protein
MPAFRSEGLTDDTARDLTLIDLKALGLGTMSQALQFKSHVAEFLSGASIEKPHAAAASGVSGAAGAAVPSAPPVDDDCNDVLAPPTLAPACAASAPPVVHPSFSLSLSDIPTEFTDQFNPKPAAPAPPPPPQPHSPPCTQVLHHGAASGPSCRRRWIHVHPSPPCPPSPPLPFAVTPALPPLPLPDTNAAACSNGWPSATPPVPKAGRCCPTLRWCQIMI